VKFQFCCDESYDGNVLFPNTVTISGFFADSITWDEVEGQWDAVNRQFGVSCFHATALNGGKDEYEGWPKAIRDEYSARLLAIIGGQSKRLVAYNCGMRADAYRRIIDEEGQRKLGSPWFACFKSCIAMIAKHMETLPDSDTFSVSVEKGSGFDLMAVGFFDKLANNPQFAYRQRLGTCTPERPSDVLGLQLADMMAYEYFKQLHKRPPKMRIPMERIRASSNYAEGYFGEDTFKRMKQSIESADCGTDELVIIPSL
jgi:hypothetical protein